MHTPLSVGCQSLGSLTQRYTIGFEIAKALFARPASYHVLIGCRGDVSRASHSISELKRIWPNSLSTAEPLSIDITSDESIATAFQQVEQRIGQVDVLVNNAGELYSSPLTRPVTPSPPPYFLYAVFNGQNSVPQRASSCILRTKGHHSQKAKNRCRFRQSC